MKTKDLLQIEQKWRHQVLNPSHRRTDVVNKHNKKYVLAQFPYPSGSLHMGHARVYTMSDCLARFLRLQQFSVLHPMGWDAFGLPAENAARDHQTSPADWTVSNIAHMKGQMMSLGFAFNWQHNDLNTSSQQYYRWTQHLFRRLYARGLAYKQEASVKWDPVDQTVLADEQVDAQGKSWRSGALAQTRTLSQWFFKITEYADRLMDDLDQLKEWPESVKQMQRDWIGRQIGYNCTFYDASASATLFLTLPAAFVERLVVPASHPLSQASSVQCDGHPGLTIPVCTNQYADSCKVQYIGGSQNANTKDILMMHGYGNCLIKKYRLRDWLISRQRRWGTPIPVVYCPQHGMKLDNDSCQCSGSVSETDTMDTFVDSSWYYYRFIDADNEKQLISPEAASKWMPVDVYIGGIEHAVLHLLYARFIHKFISDDMQLDISSEPFARLICQGQVMGRTYKCPDTHRYLKPGEYRLEPTSGTHVAMLSDGRPAHHCFEKMSKSRYNGVDPVQLVERFGADAVRLNILFKAPPHFPLYWDERDLVGQSRWLNRLVALYCRWEQTDHRPDGLVSDEDESLLQVLNDTVSKVTSELGSSQFNTAIAALMKLSNRMAACREPARSAAFRQALEALAVMLYPMAPFTAHQLYFAIAGKTFEESLVNWPQPQALPSGTTPTSTVAVQIDGRTVAKIKCLTDACQEAIHEAVRSQGIAGTNDSKGRIIFVPNRVINYCTR